MTLHYEDDRVALHAGDCLDILRELPDASVDAVVTDPPYGLANTDPAHVAETITRWVNGERDYLPGGSGFMGKAWDAFVPPAAVWDECLRVLKPGGHVLTFAGSRTVDLMTLGLRLAGFDIRDSIAWIHGQGFPKSLDVSKAIDKAAGAERETKGWLTRDRVGVFAGDGGDTTATRGNLQCPDCLKWKFAPDYCKCPRDNGAQTPDAERWQGWGTALKPAFEPIVVARKPLAGTVAANVLAHGTGALNIDGCRLEMTGERYNTAHGSSGFVAGYEQGAGRGTPTAGRWPANVVIDESQAAALDEQSGESASRIGKPRGAGHGDGWGMTATGAEYDDQGGASRFFYVADHEPGEFIDECPDCEWETRHEPDLPIDLMAERFRYVAKADASERVRVNGTAHPTVKPLALMRWLVRLVTPPGGTVLEPFAGSGTTVEACLLEGFRCIAIEREPDYLPLIRQRINRRRNPVEAVKATGDDGGLFDLLDEETSA